MPEEARQRYVLLNHLVSRSTTRARGAEPPVHAIADLLGIMDQRRRKGWAVEYLQRAQDVEDRVSNDSDAIRTLVRLRDFEFRSEGAHRWAILLVEYVDAGRSGFPVVHTGNFEGRELVGDAEERGATAAHVVVRLPAQGAYDDGSCRCVIEAVPGPSRRLIEWFLCRQLRRESDDAKWDFAVERTRRGQSVEARPLYTPRLELHADVGRSPGLGGRPNRVLASMKFTKRAERQSVAQPTDVAHSDFEAAVAIEVKAGQGPTEPGLLARWAENLRTSYEQRGYNTRLYFRHVGGGIEGGALHPSLDGATDLLICPRELIDYPAQPKVWSSEIDRDAVGLLEAVCNRDEVWPPSQRP